MRPAQGSITESFIEAEILSFADLPRLDGAAQTVLKTNINGRERDLAAHVVAFCQDLRRTPSVALCPCNSLAAA